ncbi:MAG: type II toxin-antitoxin system HicA family toxin [Spirochaetales bacterium]|nr:type II toxin-antitoxin system HicA family toxin [Spirochaetales bacterium]
MNSKQRKTLSAIFSDPVKATILWTDIESLLLSLGCEKKEGAGSRVGFSLNGVDIVIHRPHPRKETDKGTVKSVCKFLINAGAKP